jgi:hypothetical protein
MFANLPPHPEVDKATYDKWYQLHKEIFSELLEESEWRQMAMSRAV